MNLMMKRLFGYGLAAALSFAVLGSMAPVTAQGAMPDEAFMELCSKGTAADVRKALRAGANANAKDEFGERALMWAAHDNPDPEVVKALLKAGANVDAFTGDEDEDLPWVERGVNALMHAVQGNRPAVVKLLLKAGADANSADMSFRSVLTYAAWSSSPEVVKLLLDAGADVNYQEDRDAITALIIAAGENPHPEVIRMLLDAGADIHAVDRNGHNALWHAQQREKGDKNQEKIIQILKKYASSAKPAKAGRPGRKTAGSGEKTWQSSPDAQFITFCRTATPDDIHKALKNGADPNATKELEWTALMEAAMHNPRAGTVKALLAAGADVNAQDANGWSALMVAAMHNSNPEVVAALLQAGADTHAVNSKGQDALWCARNPGGLRTRAIPSLAKRRAVNEKIVRLLEKSAR